MVSQLKTTLDFIDKFGFFDVILPFLLVFTVIFGILEKTKIFGTEELKSHKKPIARRNLNAMVAFCVAFFVVAAGQVVDIMRAALPWVVLVLIFLIAFFILFGALMGEGQFNIWEGKNTKLRGTFITAIFLAMIAIILGAMGLLKATVDYLYANISGGVLSTIVLFVIIIIAIGYVLKDPAKSGSNGGSTGGTT